MKFKIKYKLLIRSETRHSQTNRQIFMARDITSLLRPTSHSYSFQQPALKDIQRWHTTNLNCPRNFIAFNLGLNPLIHHEWSGSMNHCTWKEICEDLNKRTNDSWVDFSSYLDLQTKHILKKVRNQKLVDKLKLTNRKFICTSRPASVSKTVPRPPAVSHFWVEKPNSSINKDTAATHTAVYTAFPANWKPICQETTKYCQVWI